MDDNHSLTSLKVTVIEHMIVSKKSTHIKDHMGRNNQVNILVVRIHTKNFNSAWHNSEEQARLATNSQF